MEPKIAIPAIAILIFRAISKKSLTPLGVIFALFTAIIHAVHPWSVFFALLAVFFLTGTAVTKVKHDVKARLTLVSDGASGGEGPRTHVQVLANSVVATGLIYLHSFKIRQMATPAFCWPWGVDLLTVGIVCNYAAVTADTFSSELGILSTSQPRLITSPTFRQVPPGTNGGITPLGTAAGFLGSFIIAISSTILLPFCSVSSTTAWAAGFDGGHSWSYKEKLAWITFITIWGGLGSLLDSILGALLQASVIDVKSGKIVEGRGGSKVPFRDTRTKKDDDNHSRRLVSGLTLLDNNGVNFLQALIMSLGGMALAAWYWNVSLLTILPDLRSTLPKNNMY